MTPTVEADFWAELAQIQAESIGWTPLEDGVYLHVGDAAATEVLVVGVALSNLVSNVPAVLVLKPFVAWHVPYISHEAREDFLRAYQQRLEGLEQEQPLVFPRLDQFDERLYPLNPV